MNAKAALKTIAETFCTSAVGVRVAQKMLQSAKPHTIAFAWKLKKTKTNEDGFEPEYIQLTVFMLEEMEETVESVYGEDGGIDLLNLLRDLRALLSVHDGALVRGAWEIAVTVLGEERAKSLYEAASANLDDRRQGC